MVTISLIFSLFAIFIAPQIIIAEKLPSYKTSLQITLGFVFSCSLSWSIFLLNYVFYLGDFTTRIIFIILSLYSLLLLLKTKKTSPSKFFFSFTITLLLLIPLFRYLGSNFHGWDSIISWNQWGTQLYDNQYTPYKSAYPIFLPALWSLVYKVQGTCDIWWTAQTTLFILPIFTLAILITLYTETKQITFVVMALLIYPYLIWNATVSGMMDMPVALVGFLSLVMIYAGETEEEDFDFYISLSLLLSGIASIIKQAGIFFIIFSTCYLLINATRVKNKKIIYCMAALAFAFPISYLIIFFNLRNNPIANINFLEGLSRKNNTGDIVLTIKNYVEKFFSYPPGKFYRVTINMALIIFCYPVYYFSKNKTRQSVTFLSSIAFVLGVGIWIKYFSYSPRNSYWTKMFLILFASIVVGRLLNRKLSLLRNNSLCSNIQFKIKYKGIILTAITIICAAILSSKLDDNFAYNLQKKTQSKIGNPEIAKEIKSLLFDKPTCVKLYTNVQLLAFNYYAAPVKNKIKFAGYTAGFMIKEFIPHSCNDGRYILFGKWDKKRHPAQWKQLIELEKRGIIKKVSDRAFMYFIPPNIDIK